MELSFGADSTGDDAAATTGVEIALPKQASGRDCERVLVTCSAAVHYRPTTSGVTHLATKMPILNVGDGPTIVQVHGFGFMYFRALTGTAKVRITPLEG